MGTAYTAADSISLYQSGNTAGSNLYHADSSLGGVPIAQEVKVLDYVPSNPIPSIAINYVSGANGRGTGVLIAPTANTLQYKAPGSSTYGTAVTIANGETKTIIDGTTASAYIRVTRTSSVAMSGTCTLYFRKIYNNVLGHDDLVNAESTGGHTSYRAGFLCNKNTSDCTSVTVWVKTLGTQRVSDGGQLGGSGSGTLTTTGSFADWPLCGYCHIKTSGGSTREIVEYTGRTSTTLTVAAAGRGLLGTSAAAGASTDTLDCVPGIRIGIETPDANGAIQTIANDTTAPSGISWSYGCTEATGVSVGTIAASSAHGLWIERVRPAGAVGHWGFENAITLKFTNSAVAYTEYLSGYWRAPVTAYALYRLWATDGAQPDFTASPVATSATLPFNYSLPLPGAGLTKTYYITARYRNDIGIESQNVYSRVHTIDETGADVTDEISAPYDTALTDDASGYAVIESFYSPDVDADPADTWQVYVTTDGTNPDPGTDTPTDYDMLTGFGLRPQMHLRQRIGPYDYGADLRVLVRTKRSSDSEVSTNTTPVTLSVGTASILRPGFPSILLGIAFGQDDSDAGFSDTVTIPGTSDLAYFRYLPGETQLWLNSEMVLRALFYASNNEENRCYILNSWNVVNTTQGAAGAATWYEVLSWTVGDKRVSINVNSTRQLIFDVTNKEIIVGECQWPGASALTGHPNPTDGVWSTSSATMFHVLDPTTWTWQPWSKVTSGGVWDVQLTIDQMRA